MLRQDKAVQTAYAHACQTMAKWYSRDASTLLALLLTTHKWPDAREAEKRIARLQRISANAYAHARVEASILQNGGTNNE